MPMSEIAPRARARDRRDVLLEVVDVGDERVDDDHELRPALDRDVDVGGREDAAVDELAAGDLDRLVDPGQRARGGDRLRDRDLGPLALAEDHALGRVEVGGDQVELALEQAEVVGAVGVGEHLLDVALDPAAGVEARSAARSRARSRGRPPRPRRRGSTSSRSSAASLNGKVSDALDEAAVVGRQQGAEVDVADRRGQVAVEHPHHLLRRDAVGDQAGDEGAGAGADVDVELVHGRVRGQQVDRPQGADLVDAAGEPAAAEHQGGLRRPLAPAPAASRLRLGPGGLEVDDLAHASTGIIPMRYGVPPGTRPSLLADASSVGTPELRRCSRARGAAAGVAARRRLARAPVARPGHPGRLERALSRRQLRDELADAMAAAGGSSGAWVFDVDAERRRAAVRQRRRRAPDPGLEREAVHDRRVPRRARPEGELQTRAYAERQARRPPATRCSKGDLVIVGDGDPAFGTARFARAADQPVTRVADARPRRRPRRGQAGSPAGSSPTTRSSTASAAPGPT